jgi:hypothetical protein
MVDLLVTHAFRVFTRLVVLSGIVVSLSLMFYTGRSNESLLLMSMFTAWVVSPFMALLGASLVSAGWNRRAQITLHLLMWALTLVSTVLYTGRLNPSGARPAFLFIVIPLISWLIMIVLYLQARRSSKQ